MASDAIKKVVATEIGEADAELDLAVLAAMKWDEGTADKADGDYMIDGARILRRQGVVPAHTYRRWTPSSNDADAREAQARMIEMGHAPAYIEALAGQVEAQVTVIDVDAVARLLTATPRMICEAVRAAAAQPGSAQGVKSLVQEGRTYVCPHCRGKEFSVGVVGLNRKAYRSTPEGLTEDDEDGATDGLTQKWEISESDDVICEGCGSPVEVPDEVWA